MHVCLSMHQGAEEEGVWKADGMEMSIYWVADSGEEEMGGKRGGTC